MAYTALKPCMFAGTRFKVGETVPAELLQPGAEKNLVKMGILSNGLETEPVQVPVKKPEIVKVVPVNVEVDEGTLNLEITLEGIQQVVTVLTSTVSETEGLINRMVDNEALVLLHICDSRKTIKEAAENRAKALNSESGDV